MQLAWICRFKWRQTRTRSMSQSKRSSLMEAVVNTLVGLAIAFTFQLAFARLFHIPLSAHDNLILTACMTGVSVARTYIIRRIWNSEFWKRKFRYGPVDRRLHQQGDHLREGIRCDPGVACDRPRRRIWS